MRLLVTGGCGFIGSNFIRYWLQNYPQDQIVNIDSLVYPGNPTNLRDLEDHPNYKFLQVDIRDFLEVSRAMTGCDIVVHFAAESHVDKSIYKPEEFISVNIHGTQVLLEAAAQTGVKRFHYISTDEVFGDLHIDSKEKFHEESPLKPRNPYAASKAAAEHFVRSYGLARRVPFTISNCTNNFGPYQHIEKFLPLMVTSLLKGKNITLHGDGKHVRNWLYVIDHCKAIDIILKKGEEGHKYVIGGELPKEVNNHELAKKVLKIMGLPETRIEFIKDRPANDRKYAVDCTKLRKLGWRPEHEFEEYLKLTIDWYKNNELWWKDLKIRKPYPGF